MNTVTIGPKYQVVIPKEIRKKIGGIKPGQKVQLRIADGDTVELKVQKKTWLESAYGVMKKEWKDLDTTEYLNKLRDEWTERENDIRRR